MYVTKIIRNIHWNYNDTYYIVVYLFIFNNYDTINDQSVIVPPLSSITVCNDTEWHWRHWSFWYLLIRDIIKKYSCHLVHQINSLSADWKDHTFVFVISHEWLWLAMRQWQWKHRVSVWMVKDDCNWLRYSNYVGWAG